jgi:tetratricopeptide (TPR) repeat protein
VAAAPGDTNYRHLLAGVWAHLGLVCARLHQFGAAAEAYRNAERHFGKLAADFPGVPSYRQGQAQALFNRTGLGPDAPERRPQRVKDLRRAAGLLETVVKDVPRDVTARDILATGYLNLGVALGKAGATSGEGEQALRKGIALLERLTAELPERFALRVDLVGGQAVLACLLSERGSREEARKLYARALALLRKPPPGEAGSPSPRGKLLDVSFSLGLAAHSLGDREGARALFEQVLAGQGTLAPAAATPAQLTQRKASYRYLMQALIHLGEHREAARRAEELVRQFPDSVPEQIQAGSCLASCALKAAQDTRLPEGQRRALAASLADRSAELLRAAIRKGGPDPRRLRQGILRVFRAVPDLAALRAHPSVGQLMKELEEDAPR